MADKLFRDYFNEKVTDTVLPVNAKVLIQDGTGEPTQINAFLIGSILNLGTFTTLNALNTAHPTPANGTYAFSTDRTTRWNRIEGQWQIESLGNAERAPQELYQNINELINAQSTQSGDTLYYVGDATQDPAVVARGTVDAYYNFSGQVNGLLSDYALQPVNAFAPVTTTSQLINNGSNGINAFVVQKTAVKIVATTYLFQDSNKTIAPLFTAATAVSAVVKLNTPIGTKFELSQWGTGEVTISGETGVTLRFPADELPVPASQYSFVELIVIDTNEVAIIGRLKIA